MEAEERRRRRRQKVEGLMERRENVGAWPKLEGALGTEAELGEVQEVHRGQPEKWDFLQRGEDESRKTDGRPNIKARQSKENLNWRKRRNGDLNEQK